MSEESAPPVAPEHLLERSKALSQTSNEHSRAGAQACILINGGAATAVIAYLAKDKIDATIVPDVSYSLAGYAAGVFFGALMLVFATQCLDNWSLYWLSRAGWEADTERFKQRANVWWNWYCFAAVLTVGVFAAASVWFARVLARLPATFPPCGIG